MQCGTEWPVCPSCLGEGLWISAGRARCRRCARDWPEAERSPCPDPATVVLSGDSGAKACVCESHAAHPSAGRLRTAIWLVGK
jgi:hypothetical protein